MEDRRYIADSGKRKMVYGGLRIERGGNMEDGNWRTENATWIIET